MITRKSPREIERCGAPGGSSPRCSRSSRRSCGPASPPASSTPRRAPHPDGRRDSVVQGLSGHQSARAFPASTCISIDDEVVHGIPGERTSGRARSSRSTRGDRRRLARRRGTDVHRRRVAGRGRAARGCDARAMMAGIGAAGANASATSRRRSRTSPAGRLRRRRHFVGPWHRHRDAPGPAGPELPDRLPRAELEPGICLAIEPMFTLGRRRARRARRLDRVHERRRHGRPFRAHDRDHGSNGPEILTTV